MRDVYSENVLKVSELVKRRVEVDERFVGFVYGCGMLESNCPIYRVGDVYPLRHLERMVNECLEFHLRHRKSEMDCMYWDVFVPKEEDTLFIDLFLIPEEYLGLF